MGQFVKRDSHDPRSSSMSLALRWKHENVRVVSVIAVVAVAVTLVSVLIMFGLSKKELSVYVDGRERLIETRQETLRAVLDEHAIAVSKHDDVSIPVNAEIKDGQQVHIQRAVPVKVTFEGQTRTQYTTKKNVAEALSSFNIPLSKSDKVFPGKNTKVSSDMNIRIVRVKKDVVERKVKVPYQTVKKEDPTLLKGKTKTVQQGKAGEVVHKVERTFEDGKLVYAQLVNKEVKAKQVNQVVAYGTKKEPEVMTLSASSPDISNAEKGDIDFKYKKMLTNVQLTAYTEKKGSPGAKTASGTKVTEGRTIAVDPKVIPLGWWVYIEGIGFRRAEDTGGAVKGKIVDVYFDSSKTVKRFGRKRGFTIYVIGPVKPEAN
ncbi:3D domain-containing protein [Paenibacillus sp. 481]|uniref:3D domain-containing protein n=1 Tax=Paenibacillus sp. 481 TaxID=2835869 RepID=UPI001E49D261|nr:3D domain-containing protein [Paenibacillus sp. 481]UHA75346.1 G5 domain-containing protein [Paenibacillus sp. 481]